MSNQVSVIHHQVFKLKDNPFIQPASNPTWLWLYTVSCRRNIKQNNGMATVAMAGGHQLLLGIADDPQPLWSQLLSVVFTCLWHHSELNGTFTHPPPDCIAWAGQRTQKNGCVRGPIPYKWSLICCIYMTTSEWTSQGLTGCFGENLLAIKLLSALIEAGFIRST